MSEPKAHQTHEAGAARWQTEADAEHARGTRVSFALLVVFIAALTALIAGVWGHNGSYVAAGLLLGGVFVALRIVQARVEERGELAQARHDAHKRHTLRTTSSWSTLPAPTAKSSSPFAHDIDLDGPSSLLHRYEVTQTKRGEQLLRTWLSAAASTNEIASRQEAVAELAKKPDFRVELEIVFARARRAFKGGEKLDDAPLLAFAAQARTLQSPLWLVLGTVLPLAWIGVTVALSFSLVPATVFAWLSVANAVVAWSRGGAIAQALDLVASRRGLVRGYARALASIETETFAAARNVALRDALVAKQTSARQAFEDFEKWASLAELRTQGPFYVAVNSVLLWDINCLLRLQAWRQKHNAALQSWFEAIAELESLSTFAAIAALDPLATFPSVHDDGEFSGTAIAHPLLDYANRVANDVSLGGQGCAMFVTGSNMAGKSTLLRAVGLNVALALAGGPVIATSFRLPRVRLRACMRVEDSLARGASYFHAELERVGLVIEDAESSPPIFFLLDELLRGTNERARHLGARAIVLHLLERHAMGLVATHDVALAELEQSMPGRVTNTHFTDVMQGDQMLFDYMLRPGVVQKSNALALLRRIGIDARED